MDEPPWLERRRKLFMRPDAHRYLRPDFERFLPPGAKANFNPDQPRDEQGRWTDAGGAGDGSNAEAGFNDPRILSDAEPDISIKPGDRLAQLEFGRLVGQATVRNGIGRMCFYRFSYGIVMVPGLANLGCQLLVPAAGAVHGRLIANDN